MVVADVRTSLFETVADLSEEIRARAAETESGRSVPTDLMDRIKGAGLCRLALPASLGGLELDPMTIVELVEQLSAADGSTGWTTLIGNATAFMAWLDPPVAADLIGPDPDVSSTSMFGPFGTGVPDGDDLVVNGRWPFSSGSPGAELFQVGIFVTDGDVPRLRPDGVPEWRFVYLRRDEVEIEDTWHAMGLRGTGSHDVVLRDVRVPIARTAMPIFDPAPHDGPLWRLPFFAIARMIMVGFPLGVGRRALEEIIALAPTKRRGTSPIPVAEDPIAQAEIGKAEGGLQAARALVMRSLEDAWALVDAGERGDVGVDRQLALATQQAMRAALDAVDTSFRLAGAGAVYDGGALQRCVRDIHTGAQHIIFSDTNWADYGRLRLGVG